MEFVFIDDPDEVPADARAFDLRGAELSHHEAGCSFETFLHRYQLADERFDAPDPAGLDVLIRGLSMTLDDEGILAVTGPLFDGLYAFMQRAHMLGREPA